MENQSALYQFSVQYTVAILILISIFFFQFMLFSFLINKIKEIIF